MTKRKNNKQKKGFTLIELLAVIVILAILALIAIPIVISIIRDSRENANKRSIQAYGRSVENAIATWQSKNDGEAPNSISAYKIEMSGEKVECNDEIKGIDSDEGIELTECKVVDSNGNSKSKDTYTYKGGKVTKTGTIESNNQQNNYPEYSVGAEITVAGEQYYVIQNSDSSKDYVTVLKANPLTVDEINTYGSGHVNMYNVTSDDSTYHTAFDYHDANHTGGMAYYSSVDCGWGTDSNKTNSGCTTDYASSEVKYVIDGWSQAKFTNGEIKTVDGYGARLATKEELQPIGWPSCNLNDGYCSKETDTPSWIWISNYWYWTMSQCDNSASYVWYVDAVGSLDRDFVYNRYDAVRPVLNIYKSKI